MKKVQIQNLGELESASSLGTLGFVSDLSELCLLLPDEGEKLAMNQYDELLLDGVIKIIVKEGFLYTEETFVKFTKGFFEQGFPLYIFEDDVEVIKFLISDYARRYLD